MKFKKIKKKITGLRYNNKTIFVKDINIFVLKKGI